MELDESKIFEDEYVNENLAMACLLAADICYMIPRNGNLGPGHFHASGFELTDLKEIGL